MTVVSMSKTTVLVLLQRVDGIYWNALLLQSRWHVLVLYYWAIYRHDTTACRSRVTAARSKARLFPARVIVPDPSHGHMVRVRALSYKIQTADVRFVLNWYW